jgi:hypothetical protein
MTLTLEVLRDELIPTIDTASLSIRGHFRQNVDGRTVIIRYLGLP